MSEVVSLSSLRADAIKNFDEGLGAIPNLPPNIREAGLAMLNAVHDSLQAHLRDTPVDKAGYMIRSGLLTGVASVVAFVISQYVRQLPAEQAAALAVGAAGVAIRRYAKLQADYEKETEAGIPDGSFFVVGRNSGDLN